ncbi:MAG: exodeoxyribonuclease small subunit [Clostridia bacterium]|nr:exodeoxyribonuclease small subunit [Clostridia bacterium]
MPEELGFEEALAQLENIVRSLESETLTLEDALNRYQEGLKLLGLCRRRLKEAEGRLRILQEDLEEEGDII